MDFICDRDRKPTAAKHLQRSKAAAFSHQCFEKTCMCAHVNGHALRPARPADGAVGTRSHLQQLAGVINDVALNFGDRHFWELLFILH